MSAEQRSALLRLLSIKQPQATVRDLFDGGAAGLQRCARCGSGQVER